MTTLKQAAYSLGIFLVTLGLLACGSSSGGGSGDSEDLSKAKEFVFDINNIRLFLDKDLVNDAETGALDKFVNRIDGVSHALALKNYGDQWALVVDAVEYCQSIDEDDLFDLGDEEDMSWPNEYGTIGTGTINCDVSGRSTEIDAVVDGVTILVDVDLTDEDETYTYLEYAVVGSLVKGNDSLVIYDTSMITIDFDSEVTEEEFDSGTNASLDLDVRLLTRDGEKNVVVDANIQADLIRGENSYTLEEYDWFCDPSCAYQKVGEREVYPTNFENISITAAVQDGEEDFSVAVEIVHDNAESFVPPDQAVWVGEEGEDEEEDANHWMEARGTIEVIGDFLGYNELTLLLTVNRVSYIAEEITLDADYGDKNVSIDFLSVDNKDETFKGASHSNGAYLQETSDEDVFNIFVGDNSFGTFKFLKNGSVKASFSDGTFLIL